MTDEKRYSIDEIEKALFEMSESFDLEPFNELVSKLRELLQSEQQPEQVQQ